MKSTTVLISHANFLHNYEVFSRPLPQGCSVMPVIKADAYGHGAAAVARWVPDKVTLCVARVCEAAALRAAGVDAPVLILQPVLNAGDVDFKDMKDISFVAGDIEQLAVLTEISLKQQCSVDVHIKVDTGMHRIGFSLENLSKCFGFFAGGKLTMRGLCTHFARADDPCDDFSQVQFAVFKKAIEAVKNAGFTPKIHACNTAAALRYPEMSCDGVRVGLGLYGYAPLEPNHLRPILSWRAPVLQVHTLQPNEGCSYGWRFVAEREMRVATVGVGYADGFARELSCGRGEVMLHGQRAKVLGSVCMDQIIVDISHIPQAKIGDDAWLIGGPPSPGAEPTPGASEAGSSYITADEMAAWRGTIAYEVLCGIAPRVAREYV